MNEEKNKNAEIKGNVYGVITIFVVIALLVAAVVYFRAPKPDGSVSLNGVAVNASTSKETILSNAAYHFEITVPLASHVDAKFAKYYTISDLWRANAPETGPGSSGTPVVAISLFHIDQENALPDNDAVTEKLPEKIYPLFFAAEVRIGVSSSTATCYNKDAGFTDQKVQDVTINGVVFKKFSFEDAAMMKYVKGESYRTIKNGLCYAIEQIKTGSSYKDDTMKDGYTDAELDAYYKSAGDVVQTFKFTK